MLDRFAPDVIAGVNEALLGVQVEPAFEGGHAAAVSVIELMRSTFGKLPPESVIEAFNEAEGVQRLPHMWDVLGERTVTCIADGCACLAGLWASAWKEGDGDQIPDAALVQMDRDTLKTLYNRRTFVQSFQFDDPKFAEALS